MRLSNSENILRQQRQKNLFSTVEHVYIDHLLAITEHWHWSKHLFQGRRKLFSIEGAESEGRRPEEIFKFRVSKMPFPRLWERFDRILIVRKQRFGMSKFTI